MFFHCVVPSKEHVNLQLLAFLCCTSRKKKPIGKLRGLDHILRAIWILVCEEWWDLHIHRFSSSCIPDELKIPEITHPWQRPEGPRRIQGDPDSNKEYPEVRQQCAGCPVAVIAKEFVFPQLANVALNSFENQHSEDLYVNMMPFDLFNINTLPECCRQYWPLVEQCRRIGSSSGGTGYLTIDERSVESAGASQRRPGLHVESPGVLPAQKRVETEGEKDFDDACGGTTLSSRYIPGAEHRWGGGLMMRWEKVQGGIFMASNVANTTAVWNCQIYDNKGDFIGPHGDIERFRDLLGPCARTLDAGELIWMTDRTPHESLPVPVQADGTPVRRQYFRLVIGNVTAWYADHSTPNPLGYRPPSSVNIVYGDKFALGGAVLGPRSWNCGTTQELEAGRKLRHFCTLLCECGLGHLCERFQQYGVRSIEDLLLVHANQVMEEYTNGEDVSSFRGRQQRSKLRGTARKTKTVYVGGTETDSKAETEVEKEEEEDAVPVVRWGEEHSEDGKALIYDESADGAAHYEVPRIAYMVKRAKKIMCSL